MSFVVQRTLEIDEPLCMAPVGKDKVVVYDDSLRQLVFLDLNLRETSRVALDGQLGKKTPPLTSLAYDHIAGEILAFSAKGKSLLVFDNEGKIKTLIDLAISSPDKLAKPYAFTIDPSGFIYISDHGRDDIKVYSRQGVYLYSIHYLQRQHKPL